MSTERSAPTAASSIVVCIDDDFRVRESVENLLESAGIECSSFASAEDFLKSGVLATAGCLLVDVRMGGMSGIALQRAVRVARPSVPVIFISAHQDQSVRSVALAEGAIAFLDKPFEVAVLLQAVRRALTGLAP